MAATAGRRSSPRSSMAAIAALAGVSVTTVSHVVNKTRRVAPATEQAVMQAIAQQGYIPDGSGSVDRSVTGQTIGLAMPLMSDPYLGELVNNLEQAAAQNGFSVVLAETHNELTGELRAAMQLLKRQVDAIILAPSSDPTLTLEHAAIRSVPVVLVDRSYPSNVDQISVESTQSTAGLVEHLAEHGHRRIGMVSGRAGLSTTDDRISGYQIGLQRSGLNWDPALEISGGGHEDSAGASVAKLLTLDQPPTAIVAGNNRTTIGVLRGLQEAGLSVPEDIALVGFDDFDWADLFHPRLTVIRQPVRAMAQQAVGLLLDRLEDPGSPTRRVILEAQFIHRDSCGCHLTTTAAG